MKELASRNIGAEIASANELFMKAFKRGDAASLAEMYTTDGQLLPQNNDFVKGRDAIQAFWQGLMDGGVKESRMEIIDVELVCDTALEVSRYMLFDGRGQEIDRGKYIVIWKQVDGQWKLHRDIYNSSMPQ